MTSGLHGVGLGLRAPHVADMLATTPAVPWLEVTTENYLDPGPHPLAALERVRDRWPLALHGVALNLGSADPVDDDYVDKLVALVRRFDPAVVSDHVCFTGVGGVNTHDLLPLPYNEAVVRHCAERIARVQERLGRTILVENVSSYLVAPGSDMTEWDFVAALAERADCGILLDVNNVWVSAANHGFDALVYVDAMPRERVAEIHLAGYETWDETWNAMLVDSHGAPVSESVLRLYERALARFAPVPTLLEWDRNLPDLATLLTERARIATIAEGRG